MAHPSPAAPTRLTAALLRISGQSANGVLDQAIVRFSSDGSGLDIRETIDVDASELASMPQDLVNRLLPSQMPVGDSGRDLLIAAHPSDPAARGLFRTVLGQSSTAVLLVGQYMTRTPTRLVAGIDFGRASINALRLAHLLVPRATIHLVHIDQHESSQNFMDDEERDGTDALLSGVVTHLGMHQSRIVYARLSDSDPAALSSYARFHGIEYIAAGTHGPNAANGVRAGGVADVLLGDVRSTVLIAPPMEDQLV